MHNEDPEAVARWLAALHYRKDLTDQQRQQAAQVFARLQAEKRIRSAAAMEGPQTPRKPR